MKKIASILIVGSAVLTSQAHAGLGTLSSLASKVVETTTGTSTQNLDLAGFLKQAQATNAMFTQSRTALATLFAERKDSEELKTKLNSLKTTSDVKEKAAIQKEITKLTDEVLEASKKDEAATLERINALSASQKQLLVNSLTNFAIAGLSARELVVNSKQVSMQLLTNPMSVSNSGMSLMDAKGLLSDVTGIAKNSTMALVEYPQLMKKAGLNFKAPESAVAKPVDISDSI
ncbi:hypothetical protein IAQ69_02305 [Acinetobacter variabilis]|uniref:Uncharacterized protein n=1 Tax=Acinetobacter variabilis TaxID=70346 RepID=A0A7T7WJ31_9GAMM|nr:hypothetical protein [Acinetobacter variabilis]QQN88547.1 hypothetical protein IAQ69_02305 [Acinetobacter variabilis]